MRGKFITFEGIDGAGKSTHLHWFHTMLARRLASAGQQAVMTREPGGTPLGETLRELLLHRAMHLETEALLMFAARCEHLHALILPALARGDWVLSDRFTDASFAYQGAGRGLATAKLDVLEDWIQQGLQPDLTILFDVPVEVAAQRLQKRISDKFESEPTAFFDRVRAEYLRRAAEYPTRFAVVDTTRDIDAVRADLSVILDRLL